MTVRKLLFSGELVHEVGAEYWGRVFLELPEDTRHGYLVYDENGIHEEDPV